MAFWSKWLAPTCEGCGQKVVGEPFVDVDRELCETCYNAVVAQQKAAVEARRAEEDAARQRLEEKRLFGTDPRTR